jgi:hypothetical protein
MSWWCLLTHCCCRRLSDWLGSVLQDAISRDTSSPPIPEQDFSFSERSETLCSSQPTSIVFMFAGEGAHSADMDISMLKTSPAWDQIDTALRAELHQPSLEHFLRTGMY